MSAEGKIARLRRELEEAEKEAGVPVSGEPVATLHCGCLPTLNQDPYPQLGDWWVQVWTGKDDDATVYARAYGSSPDEAYERARSIANPPHALAAAQAEVKRLREALENVVLCFGAADIEGLPQALFDTEDSRLKDLFDRRISYALTYASAALSTPADTAEYDRLVADAGRAAWQPIETAPKDGSDILVFNPVSREQFVAYFERGQWCFSAHHAMRDEPTHWMPLPDAPDGDRAEVKS